MQNDARCYRWSTVCDDKNMREMPSREDQKKDLWRKWPPFQNPTHMEDAKEMPN